MYECINKCINKCIKFMNDTYKCFLFHFYFITNTLLDYINGNVKTCFDVVFNNKYNREIICKVEYFNFVDFKHGAIYERDLFSKIIDCFAFFINPKHLFDLDDFLDDIESYIQNKNTFVYITFFNGKKIMIHFNHRIHQNKCAYSAITEPIHKEITNFINEHLFMCNNNNISVSILIKIMFIAGLINKKEFIKLSRNKEVKLLILDHKYTEHNLSYDSCISF